MGSVLEDLKAWREQGESYKERLRSQRTDLLAQVAVIDEALAQLGAPTKNRGGRPKRAVAAAESAGDDAPAAVAKPPAQAGLVEPPEADRVAHELWELRGWFYTLPTAYRKPIEMRASGKSVGEIATTLRLDKTAVSNIVFRQRQCLQAARQAGKKPEAQAPATDSDEEPDPAPARAVPPPPPVICTEPRRCTACGKPGHRRTQCPDLEAQELAMYVDAVAPISRPVEIAIVREPPPSAILLPPPTAADLELLMGGPPTLVQLRKRPGHAMVSPRPLTREEKRLSEVAYYPEVGRPHRREHCEGMPRPCLFVSCSHHLYLDVDPDTGSIKFNFPLLEVWQLAETCSLDVADRGGITLEAVAALMNLTRERIRQVEVRGLEEIRSDKVGRHLGVAPERDSSALGAIMG
jgi:hypothetical protein